MLSKRQALSGLILFLCVLSVSGCKSMEVGKMQRVTILTFPSSADLYLAGEYIGRSPFVIELGIKVAHEIRASYEGYNMSIIDINPESGGESTIQFAFSKAKGGNNVLYPNPAIAVMKPSNGYTPNFTDAYTQLTFDADSLFQNGYVNRDEYNGIQTAIGEYFKPR